MPGLPQVRKKGNFLQVSEKLGNFSCSCQGKSRNFVFSGKHICRINIDSCKMLCDTESNRIRFYSDFLLGKMITVKSGHFDSANV